MQLDVWSDIACPWCYVGKRRLEVALDRYDGEVTVTWHSFELDPGSPAVNEGDNAGRLAARYGIDREQALANMRRLAETAAGEGLLFDLESARTGNTFDAHRLVHLAAEHGLADTAVERFMAAYHCEAEPVGDHDTLRRLAIEAGLPEADVDDVLAGDRYSDAVRADETLAGQLGINAVPCFVAAHKVAAMGAQDPSTLVALLEQAAG